MVINPFPASAAATAHGAAPRRGLGDFRVDVVDVGRTADVEGGRVVLRTVETSRRLDQPIREIFVIRRISG